MFPERDHRHRRKQGKVLCSCGEAEPDVIHISWHCKNYQNLRRKALAVLPKPLHQLPVCFRYATIVPVDLDIDQSAIAIIQATLVTIWQRHITSWSEDLEGFQVITTEPIPQAIVKQLSQVKVNRLVVKAMFSSYYLVIGYFV